VNILVIYIMTITTTCVGHFGTKGWGELIFCK